MATAKIGTLLIRTLAKPIANQIKAQVKQHPSFRRICVGLAQRMHRTEMRLRTNILGTAPTTPVRPLSETRAIENGANAIAEGFLFAVAAALILGESWRTSVRGEKRRDLVDDALDALQSDVESLKAEVASVRGTVGEVVRGWEEERGRNDELTRILERVVEIGLRGGWAEFEGEPVKIPRVGLVPASTGPSTSTTISSTSSTISSTSEAGVDTPVSDALREARRTEGITREGEEGKESRSS
ncbi:OPA3-domain-containing protein [Schizophyllum commune H4-8]|uniref:OPA3-domain-containing protein n=1 Tax=Schizophyllum commune (strain H4-8 / FGSC 9210) TaxID=578458 RepID=UPI00215FDEFD|nr:OPA3-domain-containing protein [Schizophyllum commune H4-8]KAI5899008.1 OPA3-domain-containing protein [Schizophyllum commune H4-8]